MAIAFKKVSKRNPQQPTEAGKIYPQTVTMGNHLTLPEVAHRMKERSSLSYGDIQNVLTNFVEVVRTMLYDGQSVRIQDFG
ncbi:MAG: DNA-binding protein, partial [Prevotellaceae bacterium]|nr:DNA-binding protein [Prevotellaceae bacterium]